MSSATGVRLVKGSPLAAFVIKSRRPPEDGRDEEGTLGVVGNEDFTTWLSGDGRGRQEHAQDQNLGAGAAVLGHHRKRAGLISID